MPLEPPVPFPVRRLATALTLFAAACSGGEPIGPANPPPPTTGTLALTVAGLPAGTNAAITVTGPNGFSRGVTATQQLSGLAAGSYTIQAQGVTSGGAGYAPTPGTQDVSVTAGATASAAVTYAAAAGQLIVTVSGVPSGAAARVVVTGPSAFVDTVTRTDTLRALAAGTYTLAASAISANGFTWNGTPASQSASVPASGSASAAVAYAATSGRLAVSVTGLPGGTPAAVIVTGPGGFADTVTAATDTLSGLAAGTYTLAASNVSSGGTTWGPSPASQSAAVTAGQVVARSVSYAALGATTLNLGIDGFYLTQAVQKPDRSVPLVAGRNAWLRVFIRASEANTAQPAVRVRLLQGATEVQQFTIPAAGASVPVTVDEGSVTGSWNVAIPGTLIQPGLGVVVELDPANGVAESNEGDNRFPASGAQALDVRTVNPLNVRFVPVITRADSRQGDVTVANVATYVTTTRAIFPVNTVNVSVRAPYTTNDTLPLDANNTNGAWSRILGEIAALRTADTSTAYYYGVVGTSYGSGIAGIGYIGAPASLGWDKSGSRASVAAHELGHNFGRQHAPCGSVGSSDANYPYAGGVIGVFGFDVERANTSGIGATNVVRPTTHTDIMGYCGSQWISDYNYLAVLNFRAANPSRREVAPAVQPALVVWGRITRDGIVLEPAFESVTRPALPEGRGAFQLELVDGGGRVLAGGRFEGVQVADDAAGERHFAFAFPLDAARRAGLAAIRAHGEGYQAERRAAPAGVLPEVAVTPRAGGGVDLRWDASRHPLLVVRDGATGEILSLARGGTARVGAGRGLLVEPSDGLRTAGRQRVAAR